MPPILPSFHCSCCTFSSTRNRDLQYHILLPHSTRHFHKCPLCPKQFKHRSSFNFHPSHTQVQSRCRPPLSILVKDCTIHAGYHLCLARPTPCQPHPSC